MHGEGGLRADNELVPFVELKDSRCIAYVRIGPNSLVAYNNGCRSYAAPPSRSPASFRLPSIGSEHPRGQPCLNERSHRQRVPRSRC